MDIDSEKVDALVTLLHADVQTRVIKDILGSITDEERKALRERVVAKLLENAATGAAHTAAYRLEQEIIATIQTDGRKLLQEKYLPAALKIVETSVARYTTKEHIDKVVDSLAPAMISSAVKKVVDRVQAFVASQRPG